MDKCYRIRKTWSNGNGNSNYAHHADVVAPHWATALKAAKEGRVRNWRWIDTWDSSDEAYEEYEYLYPVEPGNAPWHQNKIAKPVEIKRRREK